MSPIREGEMSEPIILDAQEQRIVGVSHREIPRNSTVLPPDPQSGGDRLQSEIEP